MSLYSSSNLNLPVFPVLSSTEDNQGSGGYDGRGGSATPTGGRNKRSGYVVAPEDFNDEYMNIGKKKTSSSNLLSPTNANSSNHASNNNNNAHSNSAASLISSSSSSSIPSASVLPEHDFTTEEWNAIITKIDAFHWDEESNPLKISDYLYSLPHEYYQSIHVILYIAKKCSNHFTLLKFAQQFFQYDRRVGSANNSTTPSSIPSATATNPPPASSNSSHGGSTSRNNSLLGGGSGKDTPPSSDKGHGSSSAPAHTSTTNNNNNSNNGNNNQILTNMLEKLISHQSEPIKTSLTILNNHSLVNEAINTFKQIQLFMTIVNNTNNPPPPPVANSSNASSGVVRRRSTIIFSPPTSGLGSSSSYYDNNHGMNNQSSSNNNNNKGVNYYEVALHLLQTMLITSYEELQDEIYLQIIKQIKRNPQIESIELGYQLFLILLSSIPPSRRLLPFLLVFLASNIDVITAPEAKKFAIYSIKHVMMSFLATGKRKELPTIYELQRLLLGEKMQLHILCIDFSILSEYIDSYTTVKDLEKMMLTKLKILPDHANIFALFEGYSTNSNTVSTPLAHQSRGGGGGVVDGGDGSLGGLIDLGENHGFVHLLNYNDRIVDILSRWEKIDHIRHDIFHDNKELNATGTTPSPSSNQSKHLQNNNDANGDHAVGGNYYTSQHHHPSATLSSVLIGNHYFIWKVNYYFPLASPERDYHAKRLIYYQGIHDVVTSYYPHSLQDALFLAALQLQVKYGDYVIGKEIKELRSMALLSTILSPLWFSPQSGGSTGTGVNRSDVETRIIALYKKLQHVSSEHATQLFLSYIQTWKLYGTKYFHVKGQQIATASNSNATPTHPPHHPHYYQQQQNNTASSEKQLILAITLHSVIIIDVMTYHFLADYHYEQIYSCGHTFESFVLIIGTKANQVKSYYRTTQGKEIEEILRIYLTHHKNLQQQQLLQQSNSTGGGNNVTSSPSITAGHTSSSSANSSSLSLEVSN